MAGWSIDMNKYTDSVKAKIKKVRVNYAFALYSSIVKKTPVDTGRARANWNIAVGKDDTSVSDRTMKQGLKYKESSINPAGDESIFISNNLPYITTLEYGGYPNPPKSKSGKTVNGFSKKAPNGMVGITLANKENIFKAAVRRAEKE